MREWVFLITRGVHWPFAATVKADIMCRCDFGANTKHGVKTTSFERTASLRNVTNVTIHYLIFQAANDNQEKEHAVAVPIRVCM